MKYMKLFEEYKDDKWWNKYKKYDLSVYPTNVPEEKVKVDLSGDIDTHPVLVWDSPTTGKKSMLTRRPALTHKKILSMRESDRCLTSN